MNKPCFYRRPTAPVSYDEPMAFIAEALTNVTGLVLAHQHEVRRLRGQVRRLNFEVALLALSMIAASIARIWEAL